MSTLLSFGLANAVCAAVLALFALVAGRFCRRPAVLHSLWLLVLLKLVTPPLWPITVADWPEEPPAAMEPTAAPDVYQMAAGTVEVPMSLSYAPSAMQTAEPAVKQTKVVRIQEVRSVYANEAAAPVKVDFVIQQQNMELRSLSAAPAPTREKPQGPASCVPLLCLAWLSGVIVWLLWAGRHIVRFHRLLRHARRADAMIQQQSDALAVQMGLRRSPEVWLLPGSLPPLVWGAIGRARIFFPAKLLGRLDDTERASLLAHELAHVRRRDHWVRWLELVASALYWWYPLVWLVRRRLHVHEEECCDAWVIGEVPARAYAGAILNTLDFLAEDRAPLPVMASGLAGVEMLRRRLSLIMDGGTPKRLTLSGKVVLLALGLLLLSLRPNLAQTQTKPPLAEDKKEKEPARAEPAVPSEEPTAFNNQPKNLLGGNNDIWSAAFTPDGKRLITGDGYWDRSGGVTIWDTATRKQIRRFASPMGVASVAVSPDGKRLAYGIWTNQVKLCNLGSGEEIATLRLNSVARVAFAPNGKLLATAGEDQSIKLWDADTGKAIADLKGDLFRWHCVAFSRDSKIVAAGGGNWDQGGVSQVTLWDVQTRKQVGKLSGHQRPILGLAFSPDNKTIATGGLDMTVKLWDAATYKLRASLEGHQNWVEGVAFSPDGKRLVSAGHDASVRVWDAEKQSLAMQLAGHEGDVRTAAFSPDGKLLVTGGSKKMLKLWDPETGKEIASLGSGQGDMASPILALTASPDGKVLATALEDQTIQLRNAASGDVLHTLTGHEDAVQCVAYSPDGKLLASGSPDRSVRLWDPVAAKALRTLAGHQGWVYAVAFAPDGKTLASAGYDKSIRLWDPATGEARRVLKGHKGSVRALAFSPDGKTLASGGSDRSIRLWPMNGDGEAVVLKGHEDAIRALAFSPDGKTLASGSDDQTIKLWDIAKKEERASLKGHTAEVTTLIFSPRGKSLISGGADSAVIVWDPANGSQRSQLRGHTDAVTGVLFASGGRGLLSASLDRTIKLWPPQAPPTQARLSWRAHTERAWAVAFSPDNRFLASVSGMDKSGELKLWTTGNGKEVTVVKEPKGLRCVAFAPDGKTLATGSFDNNVQLREMPTGKVVRVFKGHKGGVNSLAFSPDGKSLLTGSLDKTAKLWDLASGKVLLTFGVHTDWVLAVAFAPDGKSVATASKDHTARVWSVPDGELRLTLVGHTEGVEGVRFAPDGKTVATASWDQSVILWDAASGRIRSRLRGQRFGFLSLDFSPDGKTLATTSGHFQNKMPGELRLWDVASGRVLQTLGEHTSGIWCVRFAPNGKALASVSDDGIVKLWGLGSEPRLPPPPAPRAP